MGKITSNFFLRVLPFVFLAMIAVSSLYAKTTYLRLGEEAYAKFEYNKALAYFKKSIDAGSRKGEPWFFIGMIYEFQRKYAESIPYFEQALRLPMEKKEYRDAALWKLVILHDKAQNYLRVIELVDQMQKVGIVHSNLVKLKEKALLLSSATEEELKARKILSLAAQKEALLLPKQKEPNFWINHTQEIQELIELYLQAFDLVNDLDTSILWKTARYQEKLQLYQEAISTYEKILQKEKTIMVFYKLGTLLKRTGKFYVAADYLSRALQSKNISERFLYYIHLNLAEIFYGLRRFDKAQQEAIFAQQYFSSRIPQDRNSILPKLLACISFVQTASENSSKNKELSYTNSLANNNAKNETSNESDDNKENKEQTFLSDCENLFSKDVTQVDKDEQGLFLLEKFLYVSYFPKAKFLSKQEKSAKDFLSKSLQLCFAKQETCYPLWMHQDFITTAEILFKQKQFALLEKILSVETEKFQNEKRYKHWLSETLFNRQKFTQAVKIYETLFNRSLTQEKQYWVSLSMTKNYQRLFDRLNNFLYIHEEQQDEILSFVEKEKALSNFRLSEQYKKLQNNFLE